MAMKVSAVDVIGKFEHLDSYSQEYRSLQSMRADTYGSYDSNVDQTSFRHWTSSSPHSNTSDQDSVPGLAEAFAEAGLVSYTMAAEGWCTANGAAFLEELEENVEDLCAEIGLSTCLQKRLLHVLQKRLLHKKQKHVHGIPENPLVPTDCEDSYQGQSKRGGLHSRGCIRRTRMHSDVFLMMLLGMEESRGTLSRL